LPVIAVITDSEFGGAEGSMQKIEVGEAMGHCRQVSKLGLKVVAVRRVTLKLNWIRELKVLTTDQLIAKLYMCQLLWIWCEKCEIGFIVLLIDLVFWLLLSIEKPVYDSLNLQPRASKNKGN
jgi:hypothetical protein